MFLDIDNTLYDYESSLAEHVEALRREYATLSGFTREEFHARYWEGYARVPDAEKHDLLRASVDRYRERIWGEALAGIEEAPPAAAIARRFGELRDAALPPSPGLYDFLASARGRLDVGIISNGPGDLQRRKLRALGVHGRVRDDLVFISHEVGWDKPDARIFRRALERADVPADAALMVGDDPLNDHGAKAVGMRFALFHGKSGDPPPCATSPDRVVRTFHELAAWLGLRDSDARSR